MFGGRRIGGHRIDQNGLTKQAAVAGVAGVETGDYPVKGGPRGAGREGGQGGYAAPEGC